MLTNEQLESDVSRLEKDQEKLHSLRPECNSLVRLQKEIDSLQTQITKESSKFSKDIGLLYIFKS